MQQSPHRLIASTALQVTLDNYKEQFTLFLAKKELTLEFDGYTQPYLKIGNSRMLPSAILTYIGEFIDETIF